jgi:phospholipid/cholesterol/gamma-HCH transport system substrate-binding protein
MLSKLRDGVIVVVVVLALAAGVIYLVAGGVKGQRITAYFTEGVGVYAGSDVRVLGVKVGTIQSVDPEGDRVKVVLLVDGGVDVPADAGAAVVAPSIVSDRYVQLAPAYVDGAKMASGAVIQTERTRTPVELDKVYASMKQLAADLGPEGLNKDGAVSRALKVGAENLDGNGAKIRTTITEFGKAAKTLSGSTPDLFATVRNLESFTGMLRKNDGQVRLAERQLADVTGFLAEDKENLAAALSRLADALVKVKDFIKDNRAEVSKNVAKLAKLTQTLVDQRNGLAEALDNQPLNVANVLNAYDPKRRVLAGRGDLNELFPLPAVGP